MEAFFIKWEMSEEGFKEQTESTSSPSENREPPCERRRREDRERRKFGESSHAEPVGCGASEGDQLRNKKKNVPMSELPEETQRLKRAAWRAASRRYYARKVARQQGAASHSVPFPPAADPQCSRPNSAGDRRRRRLLISDLPDESQLMQREAWRAASRRYYARKTSRLQNEGTQYAHLLQKAEPSEELGGSHNAGGIMCS
ncbi:uncharacterized protein [Brachionichthys hirsutus]|uniref:uncharacterized protein n=1 Tax=Brachionichthys hirsutus TaxID=412623 RepID=UPI0036046EDA